MPGEKTERGYAKELQESSTHQESGSLGSGGMVGREGS